MVTQELKLSELMEDLVLVVVLKLYEAQRRGEWLILYWFIDELDSRHVFKKISN